MRNRIRSLAVSLAFVGTLLVGTSSAFAHECFIVSRSDAGNLGAAHSGMWEDFGSLADVFTFVGQFASLPPLTPSQMQYAVQAGRSAGLPNELVVFDNHTLLANPKTEIDTPAARKHGVDAQGVDHIVDWLPLILSMYQTALTK